MTICESRKQGFGNNSFRLAAAIGQEGHYEPAARVVRDGSHRGTLFTWDGREWTVIDLENRKYVGRFDRLAVVTVDDGADPDGGLNQSALGIDLDCGEWVVDADDLAELREGYGELLSVCWEQK